MVSLKRTLLLLATLLLSGLPAVPPPGPVPNRWDQVAPMVRADLEEDGQAQFLVILEEQADLSSAHLRPTKTAKGDYVFRTLRQVAGRTQAAIRAHLDAQGVPYRAYYVHNVIWVQAAGPNLLLYLAGRPEVARIVPNPEVPGLPDRARPSTTAPQGVEWNLAQIRAPQVWSLGYTGQGIVVAGNDTGIDWEHPALFSQYRPQYPSFGRHDFNWHDAVSDAVEPYDDHGHGTHTVGTIVGDDGGANQIGVAPGAQWIGCKNMDAGGWGTPARYLECFEFFLSPYPWNDPAAADPAKAPHVINNSWSCPASEGCDPSTLEGAVAALRAAGIEVVVSAGNGGYSGCGSVSTPPAIYRQSFTVGATTSNDTIAPFSSRGPATYGGDGYLKPEIAAPGASVRSSLPGGGYGAMSGTSMAAPHVTGLVALLLSANPDLAGRPDQVEAVITATAIPKPDGQCGPAGPPNNVYGWGRIDALNAVQAALPRGTLQGVVSASGSGDPVEEAIVHMAGAGEPGKALTGPDGYYSHTLPAGNYTVTAAASGFISQTVGDVPIAAGTTTEQDFALERWRLYLPGLFKGPREEKIQAAR